MTFESKYALGDKLWEVHIEAYDGSFQIEIREKVIEEICFYKTKNGIEEDYRYLSERPSESCYKVFETYEQAYEYVLTKINKKPLKIKD